ncbi:ABC-type transport auxiliary lipoprotein family protein [Rhodoferax fermentans]|uniref:ABC-type transport auxiliary lipoprotein component domain-containing protein n=1 Tax=Rhodoferax fermentans TaxID=28066 RepID=A0A1T1AR79_RHOFE|nr:ABC-type transport auxiliary lipoprotein family protein [Rhodoferax fermentans]MBK1684646.1 hypothetical protein [Rhodoferax fermentans]OOV06503.1 hypothetical protein RF819_06930 [Rhodoferax fermentans]
MTHHVLKTSTYRLQRALLVAALFTLSACGALRPTPTQAPTLYLLAGLPGPVATAVQSKVVPPLSTLLVTPTRAASGFDSQRIIYVRDDQTLAFFAHSEWVDPPARMLGPLLVAALDHTGAFGPVVLAPAGVSGDLRLDTQIIRLQQNFHNTPSRVQFSLRAYLTDEKTRRVLAWREFSAEADATSDNAQAGVTAANQVVQEVLAQLALFVASASRLPPTD